MTISDLQSLLDRTMAGDQPHAEKITIAAAVLSEVLRRRGMEATLVGGGAIEFYAPDTYATSVASIPRRRSTSDRTAAAIVIFSA